MSAMLHTSMMSFSVGTSQSRRDMRLGENVKRDSNEGGLKQCISVFMSFYMRVLVYLCIYVFMYVCMCVFGVFVYLCICVFVCLHLCVFVYLCICVFASLCICVSMYLFICVYNFYPFHSFLHSKNFSELQGSPGSIMNKFKIHFVYEFIQVGCNFEDAHVLQSQTNFGTPH